MHNENSTDGLKLATILSNSLFSSNAKLHNRISSMRLAPLGPDDWKIDQAIVFDWLDGPIEGVCELESPRVCFFFKLLAERRRVDDLDDRLFSVGLIECDAIDRILGIDKAEKDFNEKKAKEPKDKKAGK